MFLLDKIRHKSSQLKFWVINHLWHYCKLCGIPNTNLICSHCYNEIDTLPDLKCKKCLKPFRYENEKCINCHSKVTYFDNIYCKYSNTIPLKNVLYALKYKKQKYYRDTLAYILSDTLHNSKDYDLIIPVPLHKNKMKLRGFNQISLMLDYPYEAPIRNNIVVRVKNSPSQALSDIEGRQTNIIDAFSVKGNVAGLKILIVDDVVTTTSTVNEVARVLKEAGAAKVDVCALMRAV